MEVRDAARKAPSSGEGDRPGVGAARRHFIDFAKKRGLGVKQLKRGEQLPTPMAVITVDGTSGG